MTQIIVYLFDPSLNPILGVIYEGFADISADFNLPVETYYNISVIVYFAFVVLSIWLSVKVISWFFRLLGYGGK